MRTRNIVLGVIEALVGLALCLFLFVCLPAVGGKIETEYKRDNCLVIRVENDVVSVEDNCGYVWKYTAEEPTKVGDRVTLRMHTHWTDTIEDDMIVKVVKKH